MPGVPMVGVFDTAFHQTMPEKAYLYGLPYEYYEKYKVRRYGFHGTSHSFVSKHVAEVPWQRPMNDFQDHRLLTLDNGASISAVLERQMCRYIYGSDYRWKVLIMGTRSGDIDPAIMEFIAKEREP